MDEHELERAVRDGLERRATEADVTAPIVDRARAEVSRRRRTRWGVGAAAAAAVLIAGGTAVATGQGGNDPDRPPTVVDDTASTDVLPVPAGDWRTEYWANVAVDVPAGWGYGGAPDEDGTACYPEAMVAEDGSRIERSGDRGWVGRPIAVTDVCALVPRAWEPTAPYVWLGAVVEPGTYEYDNGYVQETIDVDGTTVTVGATDAGLREEILGSARVDDDGICPPTYPSVPGGAEYTMANGAMGSPFAWVCAYRWTGSGRFVLSYADSIGMDAASEAVGAQVRAPEQRIDCDYEPTEFVVLETAASGGRIGRAVYETGCAGGTVSVGDGPRTQMVPDGVEPWAHNGIPAVVYGPTGGKGAMIDAFIGPLG